MNWSGVTPACWWICSTVAGPSVINITSSKKSRPNHLHLLSCHQPLCPASFLYSFRASQIAKRTLIPSSKAGSPVAEKISQGFCWSYSRITFGTQNTHRVPYILQHCYPEVLWDVLGSRWFVLLHSNISNTAYAIWSLHTQVFMVRISPVDSSNFISSEVQSPKPIAKAPSICPISTFNAKVRILAGKEITNQRGGGEPCILCDVCSDDEHLPGEDIHLHLGDGDTPHTVAWVVILLASKPWPMLEL